MAMWKSEPVFTEWPDVLDTRALCALFQTTDMTIMKWRKTHGLPHIRIPSSTPDRFEVRYHASEVLEWARANQKPLYFDQVDGKYFADVPSDLLAFFGVAYDTPNAGTTQQPDGTDASAAA